MRILNEPQKEEIRAREYREKMMKVIREREETIKSNPFPRIDRSRRKEYPDTISGRDCEEDYY